MNKAIGRVFIVGVVLFVAVILNLTWLQVIRADRLAERPENRRQLAKELRIKRGSILAFDGSVIARSVRRSGFYQRRYPNGTLAPQLVGYDTVRYGRSGIEQQMNDELLGRAPELGVQSWLDQLLGRRPKGADVVTTLVPDVQRVAQQALAGKKGAIVVLDPATGRADRQRLGAELRRARARGGVGDPQPRRVRPSARPPASGALRAGLVLQGRDRGGGSPERSRHAPRRCSSTPAPTWSTAAR